MGKIGDLWVRLGLKKEEFDKGIAAASNKTQGFAGKMGSMKALALGVWGAIGASALAAADSFAHASQRFGDAWDIAMSKMKAAWNTFTSALSSWDWEGLGNRMKLAMEGAAAVTKANDAAFEVENAIKMRKADIAQELEDLKTKARNQKLSYQEREAAAKEYLAKIKGFYDDEAAIRERQAYAQQMKYLGQAGLYNTENNRQALTTFLRDIVPDETAMKDLLAKYKAGSQDIMAKLANFYFTGSNDKMVADVVGAYTASQYAKSAFTQENQRMMAMVNSLGAKTSGGIDEEAKKAAELKAAADKVRDSWQTLEGVGNPLDKVAAAVTDSANDIKDALMDVVSASQKATILANNGWHGTFEGWQEYLQNMAETMRSASDQIRQAIVYGFSDSFALLADGITGVEKIDAGKAFGALVKPMADAVTSIGEMISMTGLAEIAFKKSFTNPYAAVAAGAALIAVGQLASSGIQKALGGGAAAAASSTSGTSSFGDNVDYSGELTIYVKGEIKGDTIAISGQKAVNSWNR